MSLGHLTSSLRVLKTLKSSTTEHSDRLLHLISNRLVDDGSGDISHITQRKTRLQLVLLSCAVCGIEFCYAAETAFVTPTLLKIGVHVVYMSLIWCLSPMLGLFLVPILGSMSDRCTWKLGRRRPFILMLSATIILGLLFVPNGQAIGEALGDDFSDDPVILQDPYLMQINETATETFFNPFQRDVPSQQESNTTMNITEEVWDRSIYEVAPHPWSILFTIIGVVMLDFSCDACQSPCRAYLLDVSVPEDHQAGLTTFTVMAGIGGSLGYVMGGINWEKTKFGESLGGHVRVVFTFVLLIYLVCLALTLLSVKEVPLEKLGYTKEDLQKCKKKVDGSKYRKFVNDEDEHKGVISNGNYQIQLSDYGTGITQQAVDNKQIYSALAESSNGNPHNPFSLNNPQEYQNNIPNPAPNLIIPKLSITEHNDCYNADPPQSYQCVGSDPSPVPMPSDDPAIPLASEVSLATYLMSIVHMPRSLFVLCITNLWCWMSLVCYSLYFTDFVGQEVYGGDPSAHPLSEKHRLYEDGVRMGSFAMSLYSLSCSVYSLSIEKLVEKLGAKSVYIGSQLVYTVGAAMMAVTRHKITVVLLSPCAGIMYATLFTMPYLLVAHYHANDTFHEKDDKTESDKEKAEKQIRGLGTDIALVSSMVFIAQFILSAAMGSIVHAMASTVAVPICASVLSFLGAITATQVLYLGL